MALLHPKHSCMAALLLFAFSSQARSQSCPLTDAQTQKAVDAFAPIANFLSNEPRCVNCHGRVNPFVHSTGLDPEDPSNPPPSQLIHAGGFVPHKKNADGTADFGENMTCRDCHNHMVPKSDGSPSRWFLAPGFLSFVDKDATTLCRQIKGQTRTAEKLLRHLEDDDGFDNFAKTGFKGDRGLDPDQFEDDFPSAPPSLSQAELKQLAQKWIDTMGGKFQGDASCGCELRHSKWSGQIHYVYDSKIKEFHSALQDSSGHSLATTTITVNNGVGTWHSHFEEKLESVNRQAVFPSGFKKNTSQTADGSADGAIPVTFDVWIYENGNYKMDWKLSPQSGPFGKETWVTCNGDPEKCTTKESDIGLGSLGGLFPSEGKLTDPNHIQGSRQQRLDRGQSSPSVILETVSWDLWRSQK
jgi:hypothetical protein